MVPEITQRSVNPNINFSRAKDSAETSLLQENLADSEQYPEKVDLTNDIISEQVAKKVENI